MHTLQKQVLWQYLSADKATVYLTQDEGHDIILTDLDWADVGNDDTHSLQVTGMDSRIFDTDGTTERLIRFSSRCL